MHAQKSRSGYVSVTFCHERGITDMLRILVVVTNQLLRPHHSHKRRRERERERDGGIIRRGKWRGGEKRGAAKEGGEGGGEVGINFTQLS